MLQFILKRLGLALLVALTVSIISFSLLFLSGDPASAIGGETATDQDIEAIRVLYGFDRPLVVQYWDWLSSALTGDLGESYYFKLPVASLIADRLQITMFLTAPAIRSWFGKITSCLSKVEIWVERTAIFLTMPE